MRKIDNDDPVTFLKSMNSVGSKILGGLAGIAAAYSFGEPVAGAITSPFIAHQLERGGRELIERHMTSRQAARVGAAYVLAYGEIASRLSKGENPRPESFFQNDASERSPASEVTEAALAAARDAAEERKVPIVARLLASIFFDNELDRSTANYLITSAERFSYRSLAILSAVGERDQFTNESKNVNVPINFEAIMAETMGLIQAGFVVSKEFEGAENLNAVFGAGDIEPTKLHLSEIGRFFYDTAKLFEIDGTSDVRRDVRHAFLYRHAGIRVQGASLDGGVV